MFARADENTLYAKKGANGLIAFKGAQCVIVAVHGEGMSMGNAMNTVGKLGDYLVGAGY